MKHFLDVLGQIIMLSSTIMCFILCTSLIFYDEVSLIEPSRFIIFTETLLVLFGLYYGFILVFKREINVMKNKEPVYTFQDGEGYEGYLVEVTQC